MEERGNKTIICSVLFLDIVEYSRKSVSGQISLKERFNSYLSDAIRNVPLTDRIILDTGDGAAVNFLGDVEDALKAALSLRESLLNENPDTEHPLSMRMGINLGPVRLVRDINGQPNIVGDGINVAQRVMGFADAAQILVSRSYYDAVSRLSPQYAGMFHYQGSRTDKHVREHEVYAIGYPGDKTTLRETSKPIFTEQTESGLAKALRSTKSAWHSAAAKMDALTGQLIFLFQRAEPKQRILYVGGGVVILLLLIAFPVKLLRHNENPPAPASAAVQTESMAQSAQAIAPATPVQASNDTGTKSVAPAYPVTTPKPTVKKPTTRKKDKSKSAEKTIEKSRKITEGKPRHPESPAKPKDTKKPAVSSNAKADAYISVNCMEGTEVFIDGTRKGKVGSWPLTLALTPGNHSVIVSHSNFGVVTQIIELHSGKTELFKPLQCN